MIDELYNGSVVLDLGTGSSAFINTIDINSIVDILNPADASPVKVSDKYRGFVPWGELNQRPYRIIAAIEDDEVMSANNHFNALTCYASGLSYKTQNGASVSDERIIQFFKYNRPAKYFLDQCADMKTFLFSVSVIILDKAGENIVKLIHKEACNCRFERCNPENGKIEHLFYGNFEENNPKEEELEVIEVLDYYDPIQDLEVRFGRIPNDAGEYQTMTDQRKFAIVNLFPTAGKKYYPFPPYWSVFNSGWYRYKRLMPKAKLAKLENASKIRYLVEINKGYFESLFMTEGITDIEKKKARKIQEYNNIRDFLTGIENSDKMWISGYYMDPNGHEVSMIKITVVDTKKEGGDFIEDSAEASNMLCYASAVHPALIGASPGKSQGNYSGSVQREIFTMKQALEKPYHDILLEPYRMIKEFNKWGDVCFDIPVITLTTLDKGKDAEEHSLREPDKN